MANTRSISRLARWELPEDDHGAGTVTVHEVIDDLETAAGAVNRAQRELFRAIIRCDLRRAWIEDDCRDLAHWVALRLGISIWKARRYVNCAWKLEELPHIGEAYEDGELSTDKLLELTRIATPDNEKPLLAWAKRVAVSTIRDRADCATRLSDEDVTGAERDRSLEWWLDHDAPTLSLHGIFPVADGLAITTAIDRLAGKLPADATVEQRRADALRALAATAIADDADPDRVTVVVHVALDALTGDKSAAVDSRIPIHPTVTERILGDCRYQPVLHGDDGMITGIGHTAYIVPQWLRRQVEYRDHHRCTFPGCGSKAFLQAHHVIPWPEGPTDIDNLTLLCWLHHRLVHDHGWHVELAGDQQTRWFRPDWTPYGPRQPARALT